MDQKQRTISALVKERERICDAIALIESLPDGITSPVSVNVHTHTLSIHVRVFSWSEFREVRSLLRGRVRPRPPYFMDNDGRSVHPYNLDGSGLNELFITLNPGKS
jgi:hypothetical protein